jgi:hypothetical protein
VSAAASKVLAAFQQFMFALAQTDPNEWEPEEVVAFADGIEQVNGVMQIAKAGVSNRVGQ